MTNNHSIGSITSVRSLHKYLFEIISIAAIVYLLSLHFSLLDILNINWDEFYYLSIIHSYLRGEIQPGFQTFHALLFFWVPALSSNEVDQIIAAKSIFWLIRVVNSFFLYKITFELAGRKAALFTVISTLSFSYVLRHGLAFRFDFVISTFFVCALYFLICMPKRHSFQIVAGLIFCLSLLVSIKALIYLPSLLAAYLYQTKLIRMHILKTGAFVFAGGIALGTYVLLHPHWLINFKRMIFSRFFTFPNSSVLEMSLAWDWDFWILLFCGFNLALGCLIANKSFERRKIVTILALFLPLLAITSYRNSWQYFYVSIIPTAAILCGFVISFINDCLRQKPLIVAMIFFCLCLPPVIKAQRFYRSNSIDRVQHQKQVVSAVHSIFETPTPYIDRCSMIGSYPSAGIFISTYSTALYREAGIAQYRTLIQEKQPKFLINNSSALDISKDRQPWTGWRLLPQDFEVLKNNFVHHWGPIWVAGKDFPAGPETAVDFEILIPGKYTLSAEAPVLLNGRLVRPGEVIRLDAGFHRLEKASSRLNATLKIGDHLHVPSHDYRGGALFDGLGFRTS